MNAILQKTQSLRDELNQHNCNYSLLGKATISDLHFDIKLKELENFERKVSWRFCFK